MSVTAPEGPTVQGTIVPSPSDVIPASDVRAHAFFNVLRELMHGSPSFRNEQDLDNALDAVDAFEKHVLSGDSRTVLQETDRAPKEDVTQRVAPQPGGPVTVPAAAPIDYNRLAAAIFAMQQQAVQQAQDTTPEEGPTE